MAVNNAQQSSKQCITSTNTYKNEDGLLEKKQVVRKSDNNAIIKESVWVDKNNNGTFDAGELTTVTIFGYTKDGEYAISKTFNDDNGDGYYDPSVQTKYYKKQNQGEYKVDYQTTISDTSAEKIERDYSKEGKFPKKIKKMLQKFKEAELNRINIQNKNDNYKEESKELSDIIRKDAYNYDAYGSWE